MTCLLPCLRFGALAALALAAGCSPGTQPAADSAPRPTASLTQATAALDSVLPAALAAVAPAESALQALPVYLHGGVFSSDPSRSTALIRVGSEPARESKVGDSVSPGVVLIAIQPDSIILRSGEERRVVALEVRKPAIGALATAAAATQQVPFSAPASATGSMVEIPPTPPGGDNIENAFKSALQGLKAQQGGQR